MLTIPAQFIDQPDATLEVEPALGGAYRMTLRIGDDVIAEASDFQPGNAHDFTDDPSDPQSSFTAGTFGAFLEHALESDDPEVAAGWDVLEDAAADYVDSLRTMDPELL
jgi:hypothetical protein